MLCWKNRNGARHMSDWGTICEFSGQIDDFWSEKLEKKIEKIFEKFTWLATIHSAHYQLAVPLRQSQSRIYRSNPKQVSDKGTRVSNIFKKIKHLKKVQLQPFYDNDINKAWGSLDVPVLRYSYSEKVNFKFGALFDQPIDLCRKKCSGSVILRNFSVDWN